MSDPWMDPHCLDQAAEDRTQKGAQVCGVVGPGREPVWHRSVSAAMVPMAAGIGSVALFGASTGWADLMPSFIAIGIRGGLTIPPTATVLAAKTDQAGVSSAVFNASRELSGLLGITVIGAILLARQTAVAHTGAAPVAAFLSGYRLGLVVAALLVSAGGVAAWFALRRAEEAVDEAVAAARSEELEHI